MVDFILYKQTNVGKYITYRGTKKDEIMENGRKIRVENAWSDVGLGRAERRPSHSFRRHFTPQLPQPPSLHLYVQLYKHMCL